MSLFVNLTQTVGLSAFLLAFICCAVRSQNGVWRVLAMLFLLFTFELAVETRHGARVLVNNFMQYADIYGNRGWLQVLLILILMIGLVFVFKHVVYPRLLVRSTGRQKLAVAAASLLILLFAIELVSVHAIDAILYSSIAGVMVIGWLWLLLAGVTSFLVILDLIISDPPDRKEVADK